MLSGVSISQTMRVGIGMVPYPQSGCSQVSHLLSRQAVQPVAKEGRPASRRRTRGQDAGRSHSALQTPKVRSQIVLFDQPVFSFDHPGKRAQAVQRLIVVIKGFGVPLSAVGQRGFSVRNGL